MVEIALIVVIMIMGLVIVALNNQAKRDMRFFNFALVRARGASNAVHELIKIVEDLSYQLAKERGEPHGLKFKLGHGHTIHGVPKDMRQLFRMLSEEDWDAAHELAFQIHRRLQDELEVDTSSPSADGEGESNTES